MFFGQKIHPLNFEYGHTIAVGKDGIQISGDSFEVLITCHEISDFCTRVRIDNAHVSDKENHSDGVIKEYREGKLAVPSDHDLGVVTTRACTLSFTPAHFKI